jgi:hypothetical protein
MSAAYAAVENVSAVASVAAVVFRNVICRSLLVSHHDWCCERDYGIRFKLGHIMTNL